MKLSPSPKFRLHKPKRKRKNDDLRHKSMIKLEPDSMFLGPSSIKITRRKKSSSFQIHNSHDPTHYPFKSSINLVIDREMIKNRESTSRTPHPNATRPSYFNKRKLTPNHISKNFGDLFFLGSEAIAIVSRKVANQCSSLKRASKGKTCLQKFKKRYLVHLVLIINFLNFFRNQQIYEEICSTIFKIFP
ncbi:unnamed protein product [Moneuplotes crassus]|uniref:Uncharacterized protein n=1 Tax=Euplotes crassus TaxID=5936 RepID=A0AAD1UQV7_EUPCR|nr:unnamed protein product [Moneuplotes crassus]